MISYIAGFLQGIRLTDLIDISIIAAFIYLVLVWLKKARGRFMVIGMIIVGLIYVLASIFGLYLTTTALQAFFAVALIMIVIIFQDDIRHFFESIAVAGVRRAPRVPALFEKDIEIMTSAVANLSRKKIGALIAVRGIDPLDRHLETGIILDGLMSEVLIESIFDRHVPSHDGAVIIEAGRIVRFGTFLPLSTNVKEIGRLGTRHAAGLGLAERTDAVCLIVSEEEGSISVAEDGRIKHLKDIGQLSGILKDFYRKRFPQKKGIGFLRFFTSHFPEKILAVTLACGLWIAFGHRTETIRRDFVVPIEYRNLASDRIIKEPKIKQVALTLSGSEQAFSLLKSKDLKASLDMSEIKDGENRFMLTKELIRNASGLSVVNIDPDEITLNTHRLMTVTVPLELKTKGRLSAEVVMRNIRVEPREMTVIAPSTMPADKISITMEPVDLNAITDTAAITPKLIMPPDIRLPDDKYPDVKVIIEVEKRAKKD